ncbi:bifunctional chorismate-binding protein/class IV aminotransferase [Cardiobacterium valvarum]|uniref:Para-aminobenzoate synthase component 1 n=1 Tax=Cardiobacterium valvarum TaxID=194702 RepID=A0A381E637_9GAMM|nr:bifunctional chorismate-binding protein/class IV aminotransferase [Cardiobacterium valvarum]SUX21855.1 Para-aminobenzoate synthase component 1 [Cardiobacterium valvarum]
MNDTFILLDDARANRARLYQDHRARILLPAARLDELDELLADGWARGLHATLRIPYEFGHALLGLAAPAAPLALDWYAALHHLHGDAIDAWLATQDDGAPAGLAGLHADSDPATYTAVIAAIHEELRAGNSYQINHTIRLHGAAYGQPAALYRRLRARQPAPYAAYAWHPDDGYTLCLSPELYLARDGGLLHTLPMKGTAPATGDDATDTAAAATLAADPKNRAENLMIVDLLRNDLSRLAEPFGVNVEQPFHVERHGRVLQMTSRVNARLRQGTGTAAILHATFPCGSITGAPKHNTMRLIHRFETSPRGIYTGALGYVERDRLRLNVAIRTLAINEENATFGVGGGITILSDAADEYRECQTKAAFLHALPDFGLIETLFVADGQARFLANHLARLAASAATFAIPCDIAVIQAAVQRTIAATIAPHRLKITLHPDGRHDIGEHPLDEQPATVTCYLYPEALPVRDLLRRHKTSHRVMNDRALACATTRGAFDAILTNTRGELLEGSRSSLILRLDGAWYTPPLAADILPGIRRARLLANPLPLGGGPLCERVLTTADLARAEAVILCNSLRGMMRVDHIIKE